MNTNKLVAQFQNDAGFGSMSSTYKRGACDDGLVLVTKKHTQMLVTLLTKLGVTILGVDTSNDYTDTVYTRPLSNNPL